MVSGTNRTAAGTACMGLSPPAVLADRPHCLRRLTVRQDRFTLGLWLDECIFNPDVQIVATGPPRPAVRQTTAPPFSSFLSGIMACPFRTAFPFRAAHQTYPVDLFSFSAVASSHKRIECNAPMPTGGSIERSYRERRQDAAFPSPIPQSRRYAASISINCVLVGACVNGAPVMRSRKLWSGYFQQVWINVRKLRSTQLLDVSNFCAVSR